MADKEAAEKKEEEVEEEEPESETSDVEAGHMMDDEELRKILLERNYITEKDLAALKDAAGDSDVPLSERLIESGLMTNDLVGQAISESLGVPYADLNSNRPSVDQVAAIPEDVAKKFRVVLFAEGEQSVTVATDNPTAPALSEELSGLFPKRDITIAYSLPNDIDDIFSSYRKPLATRFSRIVEEGKRVAPEILDEIFSDAFSFKASDIHFEPRREEVLVRFRVDGVLQEAGRLPKDYYGNILNRIKVKSGLRIDEHFAAQDGSMRHRSDQTVLDLRTSIVPTVNGEKVVLRLLASYIQGFTLADLGLSTADQALFETAAQKPFGMILITGPTGSGKTTTLYALLKILNRPDVNITTIEDPVEYKMPGVNQIQVNKQTDLTFAKGLRSIVRQDPDIILVGEIRDRETAEISVNAALTGHLLLSTFHANNAATAVPRLLDMGIEPFLLSSTLELVVAQRLVRTICNRCRYSFDTTKKEIGEQHGDAFEEFFKGKDVTLYRGKGCDTCGGTGYDGRTAIFELIEVTPELKSLILENPSTGEVRKLAEKQGARYMFEDGIEKVRAGITTLDELQRIVEPPSKH